MNANQQNQIALRGPVKRAPGVRRRQRQRRARAPRSLQGAVRQDVSLSACATDYIRARSDPFNYQGNLPCVPDSLVLPSFKFKARWRTTIQAGLGGTAFANLNPYLPSNNSGGLTGTTGASVIASDINSTTFQIVANAQSPVDLTVLQESRLRIVGCTMRWKYAGPPLTRSGVVFSFSEPGGGDLRAHTPAQIVSSSQTTTDANGERWWYCDWSPKNEHDLAFENHPSYLSDYSMLLMATGVVIGEPFIVEADAFYEIRVDASNAGTPMTPSHSDAVGFAAANEVLSNQAQLAHRGSSDSNIALVKKALLDTASHVGMAAIAYGGRAAIGALAL